LIIQPVDRRVITRLGSDEQLRRSDPGRQPRQHLAQHSGRNFAAATATMRKLCQPDFFSHIFSVFPMPLPLAFDLSCTLEERAGFDEIIDVRSPAEFTEDHIPGALNCPVPCNEERHEVGII